MDSSFLEKVVFQSTEKAKENNVSALKMSAHATKPPPFCLSPFPSVCISLSSSLGLSDVKVRYILSVPFSDTDC